MSCIDADEQSKVMVFQYDLDASRNEIVKQKVKKTPICVPCSWFGLMVSIATKDGSALVN